MEKETYDYLYRQAEMLAGELGYAAEMELDNEELEKAYDTVCYLLDDLDDLGERLGFTPPTPEAMK